MTESVVGQVAADADGGLSRFLGETGVGEAGDHSLKRFGCAGLAKGADVLALLIHAFGGFKGGDEQPDLPWEP